MSGTQHEAARPKGERALGDDAPLTQPMRPGTRGRISRNPSSEDRRVRRANTRKTATVLDTEAWMLNPGDQIRTPNGRTMKVNRVRQHETNARHVYVDTDGGTALVDRNSTFRVVPHNSQQQSMPGYGTPGGNSNRLPFDPQTGGSNERQPGSKCPACHSGPLVRKGDHYSCSHCGFTEQFGGAGNYAFSDNPMVVKTFSTINNSTKSAIARRAQSVLDQEESK